MWSLTPEIIEGDLDETLRIERIRRLRIHDAAARSLDFRRMLYANAAKDPFFFFDNFLWSYNPRKGPAHIPGGSPHIPMLIWPFQVPLVNLFLGRGDPTKYRNAHGQLWPTVNDKSRDLGATWWPLGCALWDWLFHPGADYGVMTRSGTDLDGKSAQTLFGKLDYAISRLPVWMVPPYSRARAPAPMLYNERTQSVIVGSKTVVDAFRGQRHKRDIVDEGASVPKFGDVLKSLDDVSPAPWVISTPKGRGNHFARLVHGEGVETHKFGESGLGWCHYRMHYSQHPERDPKTEQGQRWMEAEKAKRTPEAWSQEQEIDYQASAPGRIWPEWNDLTHIYPADLWRAEQEVLHGAPIWEGWDFGSGPSLTAVVWAAYLESVDRLYLLDYRVWREADYETVARDVAAAGWRTIYSPDGRVPYRRVGDIAGKARGADQQSWLTHLDSCGIKIAGLSMPGETVRALIRIKIREERILGAPQIARRYPGQQHGTPTLAESISQYRRATSGRPEDYSGDTPKPDKGPHSHASDALQLIAHDIWTRSSLGLQTQDNPRGYRP